MQTRAQLYTPTVNTKGAIRIWRTGAGASAWSTDRIWKLWKAAGSPSHVTTAQALQWLAQLKISPGKAALTTNPAKNQAPAPTCGHPTPKHPTRPVCVIKLGPGVCLANACQMRTVKGGLLVIAGGLIMLVGVALLAAAGGQPALLRQVQRKTKGLTAGPSRAVSAPENHDDDEEEPAPETTPDLLRPPREPRPRRTPTRTPRWPMPPRESIRKEATRRGVSLYRVRVDRELSEPRPRRTPTRTPRWPAHDR